MPVDRQGEAPTGNEGLDSDDSDSENDAADEQEKSETPAGYPIVCPELSPFPLHPPIPAT